MAKFYWDSEQRAWVEKKPRIITENVAPAMLGDLPVYQSPLSMKMIDGRRERREEMAKYGVREVDPSERPYGAGEPKSQAQLRAEKKYLAERRQNSYNMPEHVRDQLMRGS